MNTPETVAVVVAAVLVAVAIIVAAVAITVSKRQGPTPPLHTMFRAR